MSVLSVIGEIFLKNLLASWVISISGKVFLSRSLFLRICVGLVGDFVPKFGVFREVFRLIWVCDASRTP